MSAKIELNIEGMSCAACAANVEKAAAAVAGVEQVSVNFATHQASLVTSGKSKVVDQVINAITQSGYGADLASEHDEAEAEQQSHLQQKILFIQAAVAFMFGGALMLGSMASWFPELNVGSGEAQHQAQLFWSIICVATLGVMAFSGRHIYRGAWHALLKFESNMHTLVAMGTIAAWLYSTLILLFPDFFPAAARVIYFEAAVIILAFITFGSALESRAKGKTSEAVRALMNLQPDTVTRVKQGEDETVALDQVAVGDHLRARPGERIALDGVLLEGHSYVDESMLTGEPEPVHKQAGSQVTGGSMNNQGAFIYEVKQIGKDTVLAKIVEMVKQAQGSKPQLARMADKIASIFVPSVILVAIITALIWSMLAPPPAINFVLATALSVLVVACPCALGLAIPISVIVGIGRCAQAGILFNNADALQTMATLDVVVLDKTGTLTEGKPSVVAIELNPDSLLDDTSFNETSFSETKVLSIAAALEIHSEHPLASAIVQSAEQQQAPKLNAQQFVALAGKGVQGSIDGERYSLGSATLLQSLNLEPGGFSQQQAHSYVYLCDTTRVLARIAISDPIKANAKASLQALRELGVELVMLTGDDQRNAKAVADQLQIDNIISNVQPQDKHAQIKRLQEQGKKVGMVGDGINDAPALAQADVGLAMGSGTDVAQSSADVVLMRSDLSLIARSIQLSRATLRNMKQNLFGAFIFNIIAIPVAAGVLYPVFHLLLNPMIASAAMAMSSVSVVSNALRLRRA